MNILFLLSNFGIRPLALFSLILIENGVCYFDFKNGTIESMDVIAGQKRREFSFVDRGNRDKGRDKFAKPDNYKYHVECLILNSFVTIFLVVARVDLHKPKMLILHFPIPKMLIIQLPTSNVWKNANHTIFIQFFSFFFSTSNRILYSNKHFPK